VTPSLAAYRANGFYFDFVFREPFRTGRVPIHSSLHTQMAGQNTLGSPQVAAAQFHDGSADANCGAVKFGAKEQRESVDRARKSGTGDADYSLSKKFRCILGSIDNGTLWICHQRQSRCSLWQ
jgi:hypothetical protein